MNMINLKFIQEYQGLIKASQDFEQFWQALMTFKDPQNGDPMFGLEQANDPAFKQGQKRFYLLLKRMYQVYGDIPFDEEDIKNLFKD